MSKNCWFVDDIWVEDNIYGSTPISQLSGLSFVLNNNLTEYKVIQVSSY